MGLYSCEEVTRHVHRRHVAILVCHVHAKWIDDKQLQSAAIRTIADSAVNVLVAKTVANDHQSRVRLRQIFCELLLIPLENRVLLDSGGFIASHDEQCSSILLVNPI